MTKRVNLSHVNPIMTASTRMKVLSILMIVGSILLLLPAVARAEKFVIAWSAVSALNSPFWVMNDAGFWKQEGLDMELVYIATSTTVARATLAGDIVISGSNSQVIVDAGLSGGGFFTLGAGTHVGSLSVFCHP